MSKVGKLSHCLPAINYMHEVDPTAALQVKKCFEHIYGKQDECSIDTQSASLSNYSKRRNSAFIPSQLCFKTTYEPSVHEPSNDSLQKDIPSMKITDRKESLPIPKWHIAHIKTINKLLKKNKILSDYQKHGHIADKKPKENLSPLPQFKSISDRRISCPNTRILNNEAHYIINELSQTKNTLTNSNDTLSMLNINFIQMKKSICAMRNQNLQFTYTLPTNGNQKTENKSPPKFNCPDPPISVYYARKYRSHEKSSLPDSQSINYFIEKDFESEPKDINQLRREHSQKVMKSEKKEKPSYIKKGLFMHQLQEIANNLTHYKDEYVCSRKLDINKYRETNYRYNRVLPYHKIYFFRTKYTQ